MLISDVLAIKGNGVVTLSPSETVTELLATLDDNKVGAVVVLDGDVIAGIVSERDVVRQLRTQGVAVLAASVGSIMTRTVTTCLPTATIEEVSVLMTDLRVRHMPVVDGGLLVGVVSIGDVVKGRISGLEHDRAQLTAYIQHG